ncbi:hypothetical protein DH2020_041341 [Rehmannia glutinosa]|uniref:C3H1-type domain-containing protein n=1 Tax=Rehmannia glutinosa TaxID=99300 RepID=A0ABR0US11_REHGL
MNTTHFNENRFSSPTESGGKNAFDNRPPSRILNQHSGFDFKKPRFPERNSHPKIPLSVNRSKLYIPYKSELCLKFQRGKCHYGENCHFSHSTSEIRNPGFKPVAMKENLNVDSKRNHVVSNLRECHYFSSGTDCPYGEKCQFLHKCDQKIRMDRESCAINPLADRSGSNQIPRRSLNAGGKGYDKSVFQRQSFVKVGEEWWLSLWSEMYLCPWESRIASNIFSELQELGSFAEMGYAYSRPNNAASSEVGPKVSKKLQLKGRSCFMNWDIDKISEIYADWIDDRHDL